MITYSNIEYALKTVFYFVKIMNMASTQFLNEESHLTSFVKTAIHMYMAIDQV